MSQPQRSSETGPTDKPADPIPQIRIEWILIAAIAIACLIRVLYVGVRELWYDEVLSLLLSTTQRTSYTNPPDTPIALASYAPLLQLPPFDGVAGFITAIKPLLQGLVGREPHPPLFFLSQYFWLPFTGSQEISLRSLNLLLSLGAILGAYGMGRAACGHRNGLILAALLGLNPFFWFHSLNVRMYCPTVLWVTLSGWATLQLCNQRMSRHGRMGWCVLLTLSVTAGLLTYYLSAIWFVTLGCVILVKDRQRWWQYALCGISAACFATPWFYWGLPQQLRNVDLNRFSTDSTWLETAAQHAQGVLEVLGIQLTVGDWATSLPTAVVLVIGALTTLLLAAMTVHLWRLSYNKSASLLIAILLLGWLPLLLMLAADILSGKSTLAWGFGRSAIFVLPGLLLLIAAWVTNLPAAWQKSALLTVLVLYLGLNVADMTGRNRQIFQPVVEAATSSESTLIAMNSKAWGHVLRLVYYFPGDTSVRLLATDPAVLPTALERVLVEWNEKYDQILWLEAARPVWKAPTPAEATDIREQVNRLLSNQYQSAHHRELVGTMALDRFSMDIYQKES